MDPSYLSLPMRQTFTSFRFADYRAGALAKNVGQSWTQLVELYEALPD